MTGHDSTSKSSETAQPSGGSPNGPAGDHKDGWVGPGGADKGSPRRRAGRTAAPAPTSAPAPAYDDGDSRVFLEGDG